MCDASQNIVPLLHAFSCEDLDPHSLPGDWDADEGRDYETGCLPYYQTLVLVRNVLGERLPVVGASGRLPCRPLTGASAWVWVRLQLSPTYQRTVRQELIARRAVRDVLSAPPPC